MADYTELDSLPGYVETNPLPEICLKCDDLDCGSCDNAGFRFIPTRKYALEVRKKLKIKAIEKLQREIAQIDAELSSLSD